MNLPTHKETKKTILASCAIKFYRHFTPAISANISHMLLFYLFVYFFEESRQEQTVSG